MEIDLVIGPPGCGKTTYLSRQVRLAWEAGYEVMVCSLTRTAAAEVAGRDLPIARGRIGTLHSHAYRSLVGGFSGIADLPKYINEWNDEHPTMALSYGDRDIDEDNGSPYEDTAPGDAAYCGMNILRARMADPETWPVNVKAFSVVWDAWKQEHNLIDFTDMLEIALASLPTAPGSPTIIFADEAQDFSALEMALLMKWGKAAGRLVIVGDPYQSLYQWRGSDPEIFWEAAGYNEENFRVLRQSYRVPKAVHGAAMRWIQAMPGYRPTEYYPTEAKGLYGHMGSTIRDISGCLSLIEDSIKDSKTVMLLASCSYMLSGALKVLRAEGIPFQNEYRRKNGAWNPLARRGNGVTSTDRVLSFIHLGEEGFWTKQDLETWLSGAKCSEILPSKQGYQKFAEKQLAAVQDGEIPYGLAETLVGGAAVEAGMAGDMDWYLDHLSAQRRGPASYPCAIYNHRGVEALRAEPPVTIGTIHSVKGGEKDVVILCPDLSNAAVTAWDSSAEGKAAIYRLFYVAMTRAEQELHILSPSPKGKAVLLPV